MVAQEVLDSLETCVVTKQEAACRQIHVAIKLFHEREYESAITLACAAEGQMEESEEVHLFPVLKVRRPAQFKNEQEWTTFLNETRDWLKHATPQLEPSRGIAQFEAWVMLVRAVSKYYAVFVEETVDMNEFVEWGRKRGLTVKV